MTTISIQIRKTDGHAAPGKLADAEIHFTGGELDGLKLVGFAVWQSRDGQWTERELPVTSLHGARRSPQLFAAPVDRQAEALTRAWGRALDCVSPSRKTRQRRA